MMRSMPKGRLLSHARAVCDAVATVLPDVLSGRGAADRLLAQYLERRGQLGSRDRRAIREVLFGVLRWWGWLRVCAPSESSGRTGRPGRRSEGGRSRGAGGFGATSEWVPLLLGGLLAESLPFGQLRDVWAESCGLAPAGVKKLANLVGDEERVAGYLRLRACGSQSGALALKDLVPAWALSEIHCVRGTTELLTYLQKRPPVWLRATGDLNELVRALGRESVSTAPHRCLERALRVTSGPVNLQGLPTLDGRLFEVQDLASQCVALACDPHAGQRWWDACCGGGGKALHLAWLMDGRGTVVAGDIRSAKLAETRRRATKAGLTNITARECDAAHWRGKASYDGVLVDAPCSCSGTWRRNPGLRWTTDLADLSKFAAIQGRLLAGAARGVRPGGVLVYATCSMFRRENEDIVDAFLAGNREFKLDSFIHPLTGSRCDGQVQIWPWDGNCDAMFVARMRRG